MIKLKNLDLQNIFSNRKSFPKTKKFTSIQYKILYLLLILSLLTALIIGGAAVYSMNKILTSASADIISQTKDLHLFTVQRQSDFIYEIFNQTELSLDIFNDTVRWKNGEQNEAFYRALKSFINRIPYISEVKLATVDGKTNVRIFKDQNNFSIESINVVQSSWVQEAIQSKKIVWSDIHNEKLHNHSVITCSTVFYDAQGNVAGVIGIDLDIMVISNKYFNTNLSKSDHYILIDNHGHLIMRRAHPQLSTSDPMWDETFTVPVGGDLHQIRDTEFQTILEKIINTKSGTIIWKRETNDDKYIAFVTITTSSNWSLVLISTKSDILAMVNAEFLKQYKEISIHFIIILFIITLLIIQLSINASKKITKPIKILNSGVQNIGSGNLAYIIKIKTGDELENLADEFNKMSINLQHHIEDLETTTKQRQQIESELNIASRIQRDMLPMMFPAFPENKEFDIFASMVAAKQVGGDFYDFFLIKPDKLCFVIGDVSGKGIPASLFMVISKALIKSEAMSDISPAEILSNVNDNLNAGNDEMMFVTVLLCIMDIVTGEVEFANGGHNPPLCVKNEQEVEFIKLNKSKVLGVFPNITFTNQKLILAPGDSLILYTDGVTEAMDPDNNQFSEKRLYETVLELQGLSVELIENGIQKSVKGFVKDAEQSDDITMLVVRYFGNGVN